MGREPAPGLSRRAVVEIEQVSALAGDSLLATVPVVGDRRTQRALDAAVDGFVDALRMVGAQAGYVCAAWPAPADAHAPRVPAERSPKGHPPAASAPRGRPVAEWVPQWR